MRTGLLEDKTGGAGCRKKGLTDKCNLIMLSPEKQKKRNQRCVDK